MKTNTAGAALPPMGRVCSKLTQTKYHQAYPIRVHTQLPAPALPLDRRAFGGPSCGLLVPSKREGMGLTSHPPPVGSVET